MYCPSCGKPLPAGIIVCGTCGYRDVPPSSSMSDDPAIRLILPVGQSMYAIIAGYLGLFSLIFFPAPLAILFGILGLRDVKKNPKLGGWGRSMFGLLNLGMVALQIAAAVAASRANNGGF